ncbi:MAG: transcription elongation factor GreA [Thermoleophilaceae bacterium]|nr:transcription elongation factor GreA [Thermoleophilaceae bacterium]
MTAAAHQRLRADIASLEKEGRREIADRIGTAREWGDLKENAEYHAAKEEAAMLEVKIARMRHLLRSAEIVEAAEGEQPAGMGSTVTYRDERTGKEMSFTLVSGVEGKPAGGFLSIDSPVGRALAGSRVGDSRTIETPSGTRTVCIVAVEHS